MGRGMPPFSSTPGTISTGRCLKWNRPRITKASRDTTCKSRLRRRCRGCPPFANKQITTRITKAGRFMLRVSAKIWVFTKTHTPTMGAYPRNCCVRCGSCSILVSTISIGHDSKWSTSSTTTPQKTSQICKARRTVILQCPHRPSGTSLGSSASCGFEKRRRNSWAAATMYAPFMTRF